jgi:hypothetical protein
VGRFFVVTAIALVAGCGPRPPVVPATDTCDSPSPGGTVDSLVIGAGNPADLSSGMQSPFEALQDGDGVSVVRGGQGLTMLGFVFQVQGTAAPACLGQQLLVSDDGGNFVAQSGVPLTTYGQPDGSRQTHTLWLPASYPPTFVVDVKVISAEVMLHLHLNP